MAHAFAFLGAQSSDEVDSAVLNSFTREAAVAPRQTGVGPHQSLEHEDPSIQTTFSKKDLNQLTDRAAAIALTGVFYPGSPISDVNDPERACLRDLHHDFVLKFWDAETKTLWRQSAHSSGNVAEELRKRLVEATNERRLALITHAAWCPTASLACELGAECQRWRLVLDYVRKHRQEHRPTDGVASQCEPESIVVRTLRVHNYFARH